MQKTNPTHFSPQDILGVNGEYKLLHRVPNRQRCWWARGPRGECYLYVYGLPQLSQLSTSGQQRERRSIIRELDRWRRVLVARPSSFDVFWEGDILCWVEGKVEGAPLSSLAEPLSLYQGISLTEECLCALELIHAERDFQSGDPLLHLNLCPDHIWRSRNGGLLFLHPVSTTMIELSKSDRMSDAEALSGERPPELLRGRYGMSSDLYSVGMSTLSAMTGLEISRVDERLQSDRLFTHDLPCPPEVAAFLTQLTAFRASARYQSAREALIALQALPPLEPLEAKYPTDSIQSTSPSFIPESTAQIMRQEERQSPLDKHSAEVNDSPENRSLAIVEQQSTEEKSAQPSSSDEFYTLATTRALGSIAAEQLGTSPSSSISDSDEVIVGVVIEGELFKRYRLWIALLLLVSLLWIGGYLFLAKDTEQRSPPSL